jgi:hypothetical protein
MAHALSPIENPLQIRSVRRTIARLATELTKESYNHCNLPKDGRKKKFRKRRVGVVTSDKWINHCSC